MTWREVGGRPVFPPAIAIELVKLACELPDGVDRSLSLWTCAELARTMKRDRFVETISPQTVQRILADHKLKPWRVHHWMSPKVPRDAAFRATVLNLADLPPWDDYDNDLVLLLLLVQQASAKLLSALLSSDTGCTTGLT